MRDVRCTLPFLTLSADLVHPCIDSTMHRYRLRNPLHRRNCLQGLTAAVCKALMSLSTDGFMTLKMGKSPI